MRNYLRGCFFWSMWLLSIIAGFFLLICPILPLAIISPKKYRKWSDMIFGMWEPFPVAMMEICFGIRTILSGDRINPFEGSLFVMNHRTRVDWNFLWLGLFHCCQPNAHNMKYTLKASIKHYPGLGWVMQTCSFIFLYRNWDRDRPLLDNILEYLNQSDSLYQILLFPEGTDLTENGIRKSHKYAEENNLQKYYKVLHPRTTGFNFIVNKMKEGGQMKAIYDVTIAYPKTLPQTETDLLRGKFPEEVHFHVKRYSLSTLPENEDGLKVWLTKIWKQKEERLQEFYKTGSFTTSDDESERLFNLPQESIDLTTMSIKNGLISHEDGGSKSGRTSDRSVKEAAPEGPTVKVSGVGVSQGASIGNEDRATTGRESVVSQENRQNVYKSKNYRPPHLLYLVFLFWISLITITLHQLFFNTYLQIWVLIHSLLFLILGVVSNGFHHVAASLYLYRYNHKSGDVHKKSE